jgi:hypothetical protein
MNDDDEVHKLGYAKPDTQARSRPNWLVTAVLILAGFGLIWSSSVFVRVETYGLLLAGLVVLVLALLRCLR